MTRTLIILVALGCILPNLATSQAVHVVDDDSGAGVDFDDLEAAIASAAEGDILLLRPGDYDKFGLFVPSDFIIDGKSLHLVADDGGTVSVSGITVRNLAPGQHVSLSGLQLGGPFANFAPTVGLVSNEGSVWIEDCTLTCASNAPPPVAALFAQDSAAVHLNDCQVHGKSGVVGDGGEFGGSGIIGVSSAFYLSDTQVDAAVPPAFDVSSRPGIGLIDGFLFASGCTVEGGDGNDEPLVPATGLGAAALHLLGTDPQAWLLDSELTGGNSTLPGSPPAQDVVVEAGSSTPLPGAARSLGTNSPVREGDLLNVTVSGESGDLAFLLADDSTAAVFVPLLRGAVLVDPTAPVVLPLGLLPGSGELVLSQPVAELGPGVEGGIFYLQGIFLSAALEFGLSGASAVVLLDASI